MAEADDIMKRGVFYKASMDITLDDSGVKELVDQGKATMAEAAILQNVRAKGDVAARLQQQNTSMASTGIQIRLMHPAIWLRLQQAVASLAAAQAAEHEDSQQSQTQIEETVVG